MTAVKKKALIIRERCDHSPSCQAKKACPSGAISQNKKGLLKAEIPDISPHLCAGCGQCLKFCPRGAIKLA